MTDFVGEKMLDEVMDGVSYNDQDSEWAERYLKVYGANYEFAIDLYAKQHGLMRRLCKRGHFGPFEHAHITFAVEGVSRSLMAQLTRHRHASFDVQSFRYTVPDRNILDGDTTDMRELVVVPPSIKDSGNESFYLTTQKSAFKDYFALMDALMEEGYTRKMAAQDARFVLPQGTKCNLTMTINLRSLMHVGDMRSASDAQWEIRELTEMLLEKAEEHAPIAMHVYNTELKGRKNRLAP